MGFVINNSKGVQAVIPTEPTFIVTVDPMAKNSAMIGEDITVSGTIQPQEFQIATQKKQVVLVLDVSGSMSQEGKIGQLKIAAKEFIDNMSEVPNMEIAIVAYSSNANINPGVTKKGFIPIYQNASNITAFKKMINDLVANGGTNTGEGLRKAEYLFEKGDSTANKSIVFMSDGLPTYRSVKNDVNKTFYTTIDNTNPNIGGNGSTDADGKSKAYALAIGNIIKNQNANVFTIGYGLGAANSTANLTMQDINKSMGGTDGTFFATSVGAIAQVFESIGNTIKDTYKLADVKINLDINSNFSLNVGGYEVPIGTITYRLKSEDNEKSVYEADAIPFSFTLKGQAVGDYNILEGAKLTYPWKGDVLSTDLPGVGFTIVDNLLPSINANIISQTPAPANAADNITLKCKVSPENFKFDSTILNQTGDKWIKVPSYTFKTKLKFNLEGKFDAIAGLNPCSDAGYNVETPEFDVKYNLVGDTYVAEAIIDREFTIKIKDTTDLVDLKFGPGIVSYKNLLNKLTSTTINAYSLSIDKPLTILKHGLYGGVINNIPQIDEGNGSFSVLEGSNVMLGATINGTISDGSGVTLEIPTGVEIQDDVIRVYSYDDAGALNQIGEMISQSTSVTKNIYKYKATGEKYVTGNILIVYSEKLSAGAELKAYKNSLVLPRGQRDVTINFTGEAPDLF
jgi:hypothetical protein